MKEDELQLRLLGEAGRIDARALVKSLEALLSLSSSFGEDSAPTRWAITGLREGSAAVAIRPAGDVSHEVLNEINILTRGIQQLETEPGVPPRWHHEALRKLKIVASVTSLTGVEGVELSWANETPVRLDHKVLEHVEESLTERHTSLGSVRGKLDRYVNRRGVREFGLVDAASGEAVKVQFDDSLKERVLAAMEKEVVAWGEVRRNSLGEKLRLKLEDFELVEDYGLPEPADHMIGALGGDWTGDLSSVDWVRGQRRG